MPVSKSYITQQKLNHFVADNEWSLNLKYVLQKQLDLNRNPELVMSESEKELLQAIALQHPKDGGDAVFIARALLSLNVDDNWDISTIKIHETTVAPSTDNATIESSEAIKVYPNPAGSQLTVEISNVPNGLSGAEALEATRMDNQFILYNLMGTVVYKTYLKSTVNNIDLTIVNNGLYFYEVRNVSGNIISVEKLIINH